MKSMPLAENIDVKELPLEKDRDITILIVDDDPAVGKLMKYILTKSFPKARVSLASDGVAGLDMLEFVQPDVILLDLNMPRMDGFTFCRLLQKRKFHSQIVAVTGEATDQNVSLIQRCGARTCLSKPLDLDQLILEVATAMADHTEEVRCTCTA